MKYDPTPSIIAICLAIVILAVGFYTYDYNTKFIKQMTENGYCQVSQGVWTKCDKIQR